MKRLIIYDLDGTLVDTLQDIANAANHMLGELRMPPRPATEIRRYIGRGLHELVKNCLKTTEPSLLERGTKIYRAFYTQHLLDHSRLYPGAEAVLDYFKARRQAVITNKPNPYSRDMLKGLGIADYFLEIVGGNSDYPKKPDPAALLAIMSREQVAGSDTLFIGDSPVDIETGRKAGAATIALTHGLVDEEELIAAAPDVLVPNFTALLDAVKQRGW